MLVDQCECRDSEFDTTGAVTYPYGEMKKELSWRVCATLAAQEFGCDSSEVRFQFVKKMAVGIRGKWLVKSWTGIARYIQYQGCINTLIRITKTTPIAGNSKTQMYL